MPQSELDYFNGTDIKMFKVLAAGPGRLTKKGAFVPNEVQPGDNVIVDGRMARPEPVGEGKFIIREPDKIVLARVPLQQVIPAETPAAI